MKLAFDELRSSLAEQIRVGFAEIRSQTPGFAELSSPTPVHEKRYYSIAYSRGQKKKSSVLEVDVGMDYKMARKLFPSSSQAHQQSIFESSLPTIIEESSENIQVMWLCQVVRRLRREGTVSLGQYE
ncbi:uncharacterized protein LOC142544937 [Primulina tabacum]|uniref:uncharacterized protein LOC142544937 n=1 Tax=Primulina tabacum TaxID=48773 RepID=UPI003F5979A4